MDIETKLIIERRFVELAKRATSLGNEQALIFAYGNYNKLYWLSERAKTTLEARGLWDSLPERIREFYPGLAKKVNKSGE